LSWGQEYLTNIGWAKSRYRVIIYTIFILYCIPTFGPPCIKRRKSNWIGHILHRNCFLQHVIEGRVEGRVEVTERRERRRKQLLDDFNHLTPNGHYMGRTAQLTSRCCILYIYSTNIRSEYFKHAA